MIVLIAVCIMPLFSFFLCQCWMIFTTRLTSAACEQNPSPFYGAVTVLVTAIYRAIRLLFCQFSACLSSALNRGNPRHCLLHESDVSAFCVFVREVGIERSMQGYEQTAQAGLLSSLIACFGAFRYNEEIFTWATCSLGYLLPINCMFLGLAFFVKAYATSKRRYWIFSAVLGVAGACGPTNISALVCGLYLAAFLLLLINRKNSGAAAVAVCVVIAAGILALRAPGLYARHVAESSQRNTHG